MQAATDGRPSGAGALELVLSNPALQLLQSAVGDKPPGAALLAKVTLTTARAGQTVRRCLLIFLRR